MGTRVTPGGRRDFGESALLRSELGGAGRSPYGRAGVSASCGPYDRRAAKPGPTRRAAWLAVAAVATLLAVGVVLCVRGGTPSCATRPELAASLRGTPSQGDMASTPAAQWARGSMPYLYQKDPAWRDLPYAGGTVGDNGCGPTCLTMVYAYLTGKTDYGPVEMCAISEAGGYTYEGMTTWAFMTEGASSLGLYAEELPASAGVLEETLAAGVPVICSMGPGDFTKEGHFIVLSGLDETGRVLVHDPNSPERSAVSWDVQTVLGQCLNLWAYSVA